MSLLEVRGLKVGLDNGVKAEILEGLDEGAEVLITKPVEDPKNPEVTAREAEVRKVAVKRATARATTRKATEKSA